MSHHYAVFAIGLFTITSLANGLQNKNVVIKKTTRTTLGKYLKGHVFKKTFEAVDPQHCLSDCWEENYQCQSFNYFPFLDVCELNNASNETAPQDLIDNPDVVYLTNPMFGRHPKPQMPRHTMYKAPADIDPCGSNPCTNARYCVSDAVLGYRCETCNFPFNGPKCEEYFDPCQSNPCLNGGTCISTMTSYKCDCLYPLEGTQCQIVSNMYQFNLNGSGDHPYATFTGSLSFHELLLNFWFKTAEQNISYFLHHIPTSPSATERLSVWRDGNSNTFFVELWKGYVYNFTFPHLYPTNDNNWHVVAIVLFSDATINFYLDGVKREGPKLTKGVPYSTVYSFPPGELHIGYFKESNGTEYFFTGSIGNVDIQQTSYNYDQVTTSFSHRCVPRYSGNWQQVIWTGLFNLTQPVNCSARNPILGIYAKYFPLTSYFQWLEHTVSPPRHLDAFTMFFQLRSQNPPSSPTQIACYGDSADNCRLSIVINANSTMEVIIESARFSVDLIPIFNYEANFVVMTWTGEGGIFELIINGVLQSRMAGIEINGTISGQSRFIVGGSEIENRNLIGIIHNFNVWDKVLSDEMLHMMIAEPGNDMGNVVAWRDLKQPSSIPDKNFKVHDHTQNFRAQPIGRHNYGLIFEGSAPAYALTSYCCYSGQQMTISMWLKLKQLPVTLFTLIGAEPNPLMLLRIKSDGDITFYFDGKNARIANISLQSIGYWQHLALTWLSESGDVNTYLNGERHHVSSVFKGLYYPSRNKFMIGGDKNETMNGTVTQFSFWWKALPKPALTAMSRRIMGMNCLGVSWFRFTNTLRGDVTKIYSLGSYSADFIVQKKRDQSCNDNLPASNCVSGKYRARYGVENNLGMMLGCFCEENLSQDMNFNNGPGDYSLHSTLVRIR